jgi:uncharacterized protein (DUF305 family)
MRMKPSRPAPCAALLCVAALAGGGALQPAGAQATAPVDRGMPPYTAADVQFMSGMILHHAQAVVMAGWAPTHAAGSAVRGLCERIAVSQRDEIAFMQRWLGERHLPVPDTSAGQTMPGMAMDQPALMPGMLTAQQLAELDSARGAQFDGLFLRFMIQHHSGALTMVQRLLGTPGAAQDGQVFQFASDVNADQTAEIDRMRHMLAALTFGERNP